jgi:hypothetical protein
MASGLTLALVPTSRPRVTRLDDNWHSRSLSGLSGRRLVHGHVNALRQGTAQTLAVRVGTWKSLTPSTTTKPLQRS